MFFTWLSFFEKDNFILASLQETMICKMSKMSCALLLKAHLFLNNISSMLYNIEIMGSDPAAKGEKPLETRHCTYVY